ncbi:MAG: ankyrin repeat domain-containing protein [Bdellovibrio sp.]|nr:ankyrin repeat domain-containing protein [Bdellovibrio sp.]
MKALITLTFAMTMLLLQPFATAKSQSKEIQSLLNAAAAGDNKKVASLLKNKSNLNAKDAGGNTALMLAISNDHKDTAKLILEKNPDVNIKNQEGETALFAALVSDKADIAKTLIEQGASLEDVGGEGESALFMAATTNQTDIMEIVLKKAPQLLNKSDDHGTTPLMEAAKFGGEKTVKILLDAGADKSLKNEDGRTALDIATKARNTSALKYLR